jgi:hypothetical protein
MASVLIPHYRSPYLGIGEEFLAFSRRQDRNLLPYHHLNLFG